MYMDLAPSSGALRAELRGYFASIISAEDRRTLAAEGEGGPTFDRIYRQIGADGWLGLGWPEEFGGRGVDPEAMYVLYDEAIRAQAPLSLVSLNTVGPALMAHGTAEQKAAFIPKILSGELTFAIGYTEPEAGTDLSALQTSARVEDDEFVINGHKVFTSGAMTADWIWLAVRTDASAARHRGISIIVVPTSAPGFSATPIHTVGGHQTTTTYYENVRVPVTNLVGELHGGWRLIASQLNHERVALAALGGIANELFAGVLSWAQQEPYGDRTVFDLPWVQSRLAEAYFLLSASHLSSLRLVAGVANNFLTIAESAGAKVIGTETVVTVYGILQEVLGAAGLLRPESEAAAMAGRLEWMGRRAQNNTFGGGTNEVMRDLVAAGTLGMRVGARHRKAEGKAG